MTRVGNFFSRIRFSVILILLFSFFLACKKETKKLFTKVDADDSGVDFVNVINETAGLNILTYEYLYNGGGVAAADFNNDGWCDLYFTGNAVSNRLYLNRENLRFEDITVSAGVSGRSSWKTGVTTADVNSDGWLDIYVCYSGADTTQNLSNELYINNGVNANGQLTFTERAREFGVDAPGTFSTQSTFFDYDRDGDLDMFLINHGNHFFSPFINTNKLRNMRHPNFGNRLYRHDIQREGAGTAKHFFTEVSAQAGIHGGGINFSLGVSISDFNNDGWPDIYVTNDYEEQDFFYINMHDGTFKETSKSSFGHFSRNGMGTDASDFNNDGRIDLVEVDMWPEDNYRQKLLKGPDDYNRYQLMLDSGFHHQQMRNTLQLNQGNNESSVPHFSEIGQLAGVSATDWSWAPLLADFDNDGYKDLFVTNGYLRDFTSLDFLKYTVEDAKKEAAQKRKKLELFELISKMTSTKTSDYIFKNEGDLTFKNVTTDWGLYEPNLSFGSAYADLDNDGDLEIITNNTNEVAKIWLNHQSEDLSNHYVDVKLIDFPINTYAIGSKVYLQSDSAQQLQEVSLTRGFQSSVAPILHFGLGSSTAKHSLKVIWPDGKITSSIIEETNRLIELSYKSAVLSPEKEDEVQPVFKDVTEASGIDFIHKENHFVDFDREPLIPYQMSRYGPALAIGDVNGDGHDDFYAGGAADQKSVLFIGTGNGKFVRSKSQPWDIDAAQEDVGATFFDVDGDRDLDLFVVSGGNEFEGGSDLLDDRLYLNVGNGTFTKAPEDATPKDHINGSCVAAGDYDLDGDMDLFVGGSVRPSAFPYHSPSAILKNETDKRTGKVRLVVATKEVNPDLREVGLATDAVWADINNDSWVDLIVVGEWMPIRVFENHQGKLEETNISTLSKSDGLWSCIRPMDLDEDGDIDFIVGNAGTNLPWTITPTKPLTLRYGDFNADNRIDPIISYYNFENEYPIATRDELLFQLPVLKKHYNNYSSYASATMSEILSQGGISSPQYKCVRTTQSISLINDGFGNFQVGALPRAAQMSAIRITFLMKKGQKKRAEIFAYGNFYSAKTQFGHLDASFGVVLAYDRSSFSIKNTSLVNGLFDARKGGIIDQRYVLILMNSAPIRLFEVVK
ncbi:MAG: VCBS repeat-containing protein [Bacteroidetes bacterium]|nr:VCBS repeat-containing protein [Bacteroidota bacterium]